MDEATFAERTNALFREVYLQAVRRIKDARERLSPETMALLLHMAQAGPLTLSEMAEHLGRALSTLSAKVDQLQAQGLLTRQADPTDGRRALVWLTPAGREALADGLQVLDGERLRAASTHLSSVQRTTIVNALAALQSALSACAKEKQDEPSV